jgi:hypothetical protein
MSRRVDDFPVPRSPRRRMSGRDRARIRHLRKTTVMALGTLALGLALFVAFFGLVAACDRL